LDIRTPLPETAALSLAPSRTGALRFAKAQATWVADPANYHALLLHVPRA